MCICALTDRASRNENDKIMRFSAPGRTEIGGNHTDHQRGCVLAGAVDLETAAEVRLNGTDCIRVFSDGYAPVEISLDDLAPREDERTTTAALVRGIAASFAERGAHLQGLDASVRSTVLPGSGLSSSAAFEVLFGTIFNELFMDKKRSAVEIAQIGQYAENIYFGKPCGLMDQTASAVGGLVFIDFADPAAPLVEKLDFDFSREGYALCIIDSGADHAGLTDEYAAVTQELKSVCAHFGKEVLREVPETDFFAALPALRRQSGDRAVLRAVHFYQEQARVPAMVDALKKKGYGCLSPARKRLRAQLMDVSAEYHARRRCDPSGDGRGAGAVRYAFTGPGRFPRPRRRRCRHRAGLCSHGLAACIQARHRARAG